MNEETAFVVGPVLIIAVLAVFMAWVVWLYSQRKKERARAELEVRRRVLEKFATGEELTAFLASGGGRKFLEDISTDHASQADRILKSLQRGAILTILGLGLWLLVAWNPRDMEAAGVFGTIALAVGLGYLASAGVAYNLSRRWGLLPSRVD